MYGKQLRKTILLQKQRQRDSLTKQDQQSVLNEENHRIIIKVFIQQIKKLLGIIIELQFLEKESFVLDPSEVKKQIALVQKSKEHINLKSLDDEVDYKFLKTVHLYIWRSLAPFQEELYCTLKKINQAFESQVLQRVYSAKQFFQKVTKILQQKTIQVKNKILQNCKRNFKILENEKSKQKWRKNKNSVKLKDIEKDIKQTIYGQIDLDKIEAIIYFIEGLQVKDNVNNIFEKQWERNKRAHKDITEYSKKYKNKDYRIRSKSHPNKKREDLREKKQNHSVYSVQLKGKDKQRQRQISIKKKRPAVLKPIQNKLKIKKP